MMIDWLIDWLIDLFIYWLEGGWDMNYPLTVTTGLLTDVEKMLGKS